MTQKTKLTKEQEAMLAQSIQELESSAQNLQELLKYGDKMIARHQRKIQELKAKTQ